MGAAAYNRGSKAIRESISRDRKPVDSVNYVIAQKNDRITLLETRVAELEAEIAKARRLINVLRIAKADMATKLISLHNIYSEVKREFISTHSLQHAYGAMVLARRLGLW